MDFGALPPEVNSGLMYTGPGSGPMITAAATWDALAAELGTTASSYQTVIDGLTGGSWHGPTSAAMATAAGPYVQWMGTSAAQAEQTASQARAAAAGYEAAFSATVPPPVIAANRSLLMSLIATNFLGQNTAAIAATEFHYAEMWAQDAAAMYGYAGSSAAATQLTPFNEPPQITDAGAAAAQSNAVAQAAGTSAAGNAQSMLSQLISAVPGTLQNLTSPVSSVAAAQAESPLLSFLDAITGPTSPLSYFPIAGVPYLLGFQNILLPMAGENLAGALAKNSTLPIAANGILGGELAAGTHALGANAGTSVSAGLGQAGMVGKLSVPQGWASAAPAVRPVAFTLPSTGLAAAPTALADASGSLFSQTALSGLAGRALAGTGGSAVRSAGGSPGVSIGGDAATTATIIVIPADE